MKFQKHQAMNSCQHLEQDAVCLCSIVSEKKKLSDYTAEEVLSIGLIIFESVCEEIGSSDKMFLAFSAAKNKLDKSTMDPKKVKKIFAKYVEFADNSRKKNIFVQSGFF